MNKTFKIFAGIIIFLIIISIILSFTGKDKKKTEEAQCYKKTITIWSPFNGSNIKTKEITESLRKYCVTLNVRQKQLQNIKEDVLSELASGNGPAIIYTDYDFLIKNKEIFADKPKKPWLNVNDYPAVVQGVFKNNIYVYPATYDTLVLFWNKEILNSIGYTEPPQTFEEIIQIIPKIKKLDSSGQIVLSPIAIGSSQNINSYFEIFLAMIKMLNPNMKKTSSGVSGALFTTLNYYTQFTDNKSENFSWHPNMENQRDAFLREQVAMIIDFYSFKDEIIKRNPRFNFGIAALPKFNANPKKTNYIEPYFLAVTKTDPEISWLFLEMLDKNYQKFVKDLNLNPIKISMGKNLEGENKILFNEMIIGDNFSDVNKDYIKPYIKQDIDNWLSSQKDVKQLIYSKQAYKFYK